MKRHTLLIAALAALVTGPVAAQRDAFDGTWEGTLKLAAQHGTLASAPGNELPVSVRLRGRNVRVEFGADPDVVGVGTEAFPWWVDGLPQYQRTGARIEKHDAAALIYAATTTGDFIATWQMSWTKTEPDKVLVFFWQVMNFKRGEPGDARSRVALAFLGELTRTAATH